jgi:hypothetical protein
VGTVVLGYGSGGTVVLLGRLDGRPVAVKRLLARFAELARTEINALIHTDDHPNVVSVRSYSTAASMMFLGAPCAAMPSRGMILPAFSRCCGPCGGSANGQPSTSHAARVCLCRCSTVNQINRATH